MKQILVNPKEGKIILDEVPAPLCKDNGVLIPVQYSLISTGTELASFRKSENSYLKKAIADKDFRGKAIDFVKSQGIKKSIDILKGKDNFSPTGYSGAGIIIDVGKNVTDLAIGDKVAYGGVNHAEIVCAPMNFVVKLQDTVEFKEAAFTTLGSIAMQSVRRAKVELGETVLVIGLGLVGQLVNQLLQVAGCHVIGSDLSEKRIALAKEFGLERGIIANAEDFMKEVMDYTDQIGVDAVIICAQSRSSAIINQAMEVCRERGRVIVVGDVGLDLQRQPFYLNELDLKISRAYGPGSTDKNYTEKGIDYPIGYVKWTANRNMEEFVKLISQDKVNVKKLISKEFDIKDVQSAYEMLLENKEDVIAVVLKYNQPDVAKPISRITTISKRKIEKSKNNIYVAVIGTGGISKGYHLPNLKKIKGANIYAIVSGIGVNAKKIAKEYNAKYCTTDYKEVLEDKNVDCVLIATHHNLHKEMIIESAKARKHIYLEKPMAMNYEDVKEIVKTIKDTGVIMTVGTNRRYSPLSSMAKEMIEKKGKPVLINYRINTTTLPLGHWINDPVEGGGRIIGEAPHFFDLMYWLSDSEPVRIYAECVDSDKKNMIKENNIVSTIKFADGSIASLSYCDFGSSNFTREKVEIFTGGTVIEINDFREVRTSDGLRKKYNFLNIGLYESLENFIAVLQGKKNLELGVEDGARSTICALKVLESLNVRKPVDVNLSEYL
jgi:predicted dehydrogenase